MRSRLVRLCWIPFVANNHSEDERASRKIDEHGKGWRTGLNGRLQRKRNSRNAMKAPEKRMEEIARQKLHCLMAWNEGCDEPTARNR